MQIKQLLQDEDAVSPVIGVILMVAITVILAAVIGTFVLGLGDQVQSSAPNANFQFEYTDSGGFETSSYDDADQMTITHNGGQDVSASNVAVQIGGTEVAPLNDNTNTDYISSASNEWPDTISTGSSVVITEANTNAAGNWEAGEDVLVIWTSPNGDSSNTIGSSTVPN